MTSELFNAVQSGKTAYTANGAVTNATSGTACLDLFSIVGAMRGKDIIPSFSKAIVENFDVAMRIMLWSRDIRGGAGERQLFKDMLLHVEQNYDNEITQRVMSKTAFVLGRWDDILCVTQEANKDFAASLVAVALDKGDALCAKWMPREKMKVTVGGKRVSRKNPTAMWLIKKLDIHPKAYRLILTRLSDTVEQKMCAGKFSDINYGGISSLASARYAKAFCKHDLERYQEYLGKVEKGEAKINAGAVYPYDVVKTLRQGAAQTANAQWKALPDFMDGSDQMILPMVDVSGSMTCPINSDYNSTINCRDVAISLGMYISERNTGVFKDQFLTFSSKSEMIHLRGTLSQRYNQMMTSNWSMNTDLQGAFDLILKAAERANLNPNQMPSKVLILSDMEFDACQGGGYGYREHNVEKLKNFDGIKAQYSQAGYEMPEIVFWNLNGRSDNFAVKHNDLGVAMVSGCSPSILKSILSGKVTTPMDLMLDTLMIDRYNY